jgi:small subunit ribosomal protein S8
MTDPISDLLARIRNAILSRKSSLDVPASQLKLRVAELLRDEGYLTAVSFSKDGPQGTITLTLKWDGQNRSAINGLRRVSRPGQRHYAGKAAVKRVRGGLGVAIVSTSKGLLSDRDARKQGIGGEVLCEVW